MTPQLDRTSCCFNLMVMTCLLLLSLFLSTPLLGQSRTDSNEGSEVNFDSLLAQVGVDEQLGSVLDLNLTFTDEDGQAVVLKDWIDRPTLLLFVFLRCPMTCGLMLGSMANHVEKITMTPDQDFRIAVVSFDPDDDPARALAAKNTYTRLLSDSFPKAAWKFFTGSEQAIAQLTGQAGYRFVKQEQHAFMHPNVLIVLAPDGKIIRYLYGPSFLPFDMNMALTEAAKGRPGHSIKKALSYCFSYDPSKKTYTLRTMRVMGSLMLLALMGFLLFLVRKRPA